ncbi:MAG TPA: type II and III secretion system protein family protein [Thermohalobaculum sp.]|nr:type II and III secretion system protein family protein [Thermohalobaculum sp.]
MTTGAHGGTAAGWARFAATLLLAAVVAAAPAAGARAEAPLIHLTTDGTSAKIHLPIGQSKVLRTAVDVETLVVGEPAIADVVLLSDRTFYVLGRGPGQTNVTVFGAGEWPLGVIDVEVGVDVADLRLALAQAAPEAAIDVQSVNGRLRLKGLVPDATTLARVMEIAAQYGEAPVINALRVEEAQQVLLEVRIIEASRNAGRDLGISLFADRTTDDGGTRFRTREGMVGGALPFGSLLTQILSNGLRVDLLIQALEDKGLARRLAEPNLTALSGETASFLAGGEVPIPINEQDGEVTVEFKEFGVRLTFTPVVLGNGMIHLTLEPEVSEIDFSTTVQAGGISLPGFTTRRAQTTVELRDGESFAIAGLLQSSNTRRHDQVPLLGDIPVIGALFRSASFQKQETDLVIIVTPRLARPVGPGLELATPLDRTLATSSAEFFLTGRQEIDADRLLAIAEGRGVIGPYGHIIDLPAAPEPGL